MHPPDHAIRCQIQLVQCRRVALPPFAEREQYRLQAQPQRGRGVVHTQWDLTKYLAVNEAVLLHLAELLDEHLLADGRNQPLPCCRC